MTRHSGSDEDLRAVTSCIAKAHRWRPALVVMLMLALGNAVGMSRRYQRALERRT